MLRELRAWCDVHGVHLILDEVMTGFGRTGAMFACLREQVIPDFLCVAKGLTGGYLPMAATLVTAEIYDGFRGGADRAFYYGHSYTANQLGCAAALASLDIFEQEKTLENQPQKSALLAELLSHLQKNHAVVHEVRQCGLVVGVELRSPGGKPFQYSKHVGENVCLAARPHGLLIRPVLDTVVLMPPLSITEEEIKSMVDALSAAITALFPV
jgi:adenosylmethionine-8-amino-7-oxononanoate aminotransferase